MTAKKPKVLTRYKSPSVTSESSGDAEPVPRAKRKRRAFDVPRWLALIPALFFGAAGVILIGSGILRIGLMVFYNLTAGDVVRSGANRELWGQLTLTRGNFVLLLWSFLNGAGAFAVGMSWMHDESRRAVRLTVALVGFLIVSAWISSVVSGRASRSTLNAPPAAVAPQGFPAQTPVFPGPPAQGHPGRAPVVSDSNVPVVTIFLDRMTDAERSQNEAVLKREFQSLKNYVPGTVRIEGNTLVWRATILVQYAEQHKMDAIAILRRNNIRLSEFSERWLKGQGSRPPIPGLPPSPPR